MLSLLDLSAQPALDTPTITKEDATRCALLELTPQNKILALNVEKVTFGQEQIAEKYVQKNNFTTKPQISANALKELIGQE